MPQSCDRKGTTYSSKTPAATAPAAPSATRRDPWKNRSAKCSGTQNTSENRDSKQIMSMAAWPQ